MQETLVQSESGRSPIGGNGNPLQYSCLESSMGRGGWWATVHGVTKNPTWLIMHTPPRHVRTALTAVADLGPNGNLSPTLLSFWEGLAVFQGSLYSLEFLGPSCLPLGKPCLMRMPTQRKRDYFSVMSSEVLNSAIPGFIPWVFRCCVPRDLPFLV